MRTPLLAAALIGSSFVAWRARADEGMWLLNQFPADRVKQAYGFAPDAKWLHHVQLGSVRLAGGCSGSFVSDEGLVLTNHHCAHSCIEQLSTPTVDRVKDGFFARTQADEVRCPTVEVDDLTDITEITPDIQKATTGLTDKAFNDALKAVSAKLEKACADQDPHPEKIRCEVVTLFHGGRYDLYKYRRYQDVRLAFAPELAAAFFGGDPDNFNFPRYDLDLSLLRVYEDGKPLRPSDHFRLSKRGTKEGDLVFVSGHPGGTDRQLTLAELAYTRDVAQPERLLYLAELRGMLTEYGRRGAEERRHSGDLLFGIENSFKALHGRELALVDRELMSQKQRDEADFRAKASADPELSKVVPPAFDAIAKALDRLREIHLQYGYEEAGRAFQSQLFNIARTLVRGTAERQKPNDTRFPEFRDTALPQVTQGLFSAAPIYPELEIARLTFSLTKLREALGADDPFVRRVLGRKSPEMLAKELVDGSKLADVAVRKRLWDMAPDKMAADAAASSDPLIALAAAIDPDGRAIRKTYEDEVEAVIKKNEELLARARGKLYRTSTYPDATFTLRLSYGQVEGWTERGRPIAPYTTFGGAFDRATGEEPFDLPQSWSAAKAKLKLDTPFDLATTNDVIGGNSGSPLLDRRAEVVGLIFDGNIHSLGGDYGYEGRDNRSVAVDSRAILEALRKIYGADKLADELSR